MLKRILNIFSKGEEPTDLKRLKSHLQINRQHFNGELVEAWKGKIVGCSRDFVEHIKKMLESESYEFLQDGEASSRDWMIPYLLKTDKNQYYLLIIFEEEEFYSREQCVVLHPVSQLPNIDMSLFDMVTK